MPVSEFYHSVKTNQVFVDLEKSFFSATGRSVGPGERASWLGSLPRLVGALELADLPDSTYIGLEVQIPYYSERIDAVLYGHDFEAHPFAIIVELKQWSDVDLTEDGRIAVPMRSGVVHLAHPSQQVAGYRRHLASFVRAFHNEPVVRLDGCVYAHNYPERAGSLFDPQYIDVMSNAPVFCAGDAEALALFFRSRLGEDRGAEVVDRVRREGLAPSKLLIDYASEMIRQQDVFTMLDEQIPAQHSIVQSMNEAIRSRSKSIILVEGGPGTGKSVIALDALGHAIRKKQVVHLVSGSAAFTHGMRQLLGKELAPLVRFTDFFWAHAENSIDVLIVDEAHRIRAKSEPKVIAAKRPKISQLEELIRAARVTVLFMDTNQIIQPDESGDPSQVQELAKRLGLKLTRHRLRSQFRCDGSDEYLRWADGLFELDGIGESTSPGHAHATATLFNGETVRNRTGPHVIGPYDATPNLASEARERAPVYRVSPPLFGEAGPLRVPETFDLDVLDSPIEVLDWVREKNQAEPNSARLTAGWCWPWSDPRPDGSLVNDIVIGDFTFPWELKNGKRGKPGIPEAKHWAVNPLGADQAGTVYSVQGFEFRYVGILMGADLVIRSRRWVVCPKENYRKVLRAKPPEIASIFIRRIYRTLFTRPLRGLRVYSVDVETREFLRSRIARTADVE
jgi:hypothetical protein